MQDGAPGGDLRQHQRPYAHPLEVLSGERLSAAALARLLHLDERTVRNRARWSANHWEEEEPGCFLLLHDPETEAPITLASGERVAITRMPPAGASPGRPKGRQSWQFALVEPGGGCGTFHVPAWVARA